MLQMLRSGQRETKCDIQSVMLCPSLRPKQYCIVIGLYHSFIYLVEFLCKPLDFNLFKHCNATMPSISGFKVLPSFDINDSIYLTGQQGDFF